MNSNDGDYGKAGVALIRYAGVNTNKQSEENIRAHAQIRLHFYVSCSKLLRTFYIYLQSVTRATPSLFLRVLNKRRFRMIKING